MQASVSTSCAACSLTWAFLSGCGSHHMFSRPEIAELINLQRDGSNAKPYQVKQLRNLIVKYKLEI